MRKYLLIILLCSIFSLSACGSSDNSESQSLYPNDSNIEDGGSGLAPEYTDPSFNVETNANPSNKTDVEATVEMVYDSVVSIEAYSNTALSRGSGVLFSSDDNLGLSFIVTCHHVIDGGDRFYVNLSDGSDYEARIVGAYIDLDLAVLSIEATNLTYASMFDDSDKLKLGSSVVCIGNPLGTLPGSVSAGIISYINRSVPVADGVNRTLLQTDVAINSGNSGGGLFNTSGALIGIVNAKYSSEGIEGLGFAIPINDVRMTVNEIMSSARYDKANKCWLTGYVENDYELAFSILNGYYQSGGFVNPELHQVVYISNLIENPLYSGSGQFKDQDIIKAVEVDYKDSSKKDSKLKSFTSAKEVIGYLNSSSLEVGDKLKFKVLRDNRELNIEFEIVQFRYIA